MKEVLEYPVGLAPRFISCCIFCRCLVCSLLLFTKLSREIYSWTFWKFPIAAGIVVFLLCPSRFWVVRCGCFWSPRAMSFLLFMFNSVVNGIMEPLLTVGDRVARMALAEGDSIRNSSLVSVRKYYGVVWVFVLRLFEDVVILTNELFGPRSRNWCLWSDNMLPRSAAPKDSSTAYLPLRPVGRPASFNMVEILETLVSWVVSWN